MLFLCQQDTRQCYLVITLVSNPGISIRFLSNTDIMESKIFVLVKIMINTLGITFKTAQAEKGS